MYGWLAAVTMLAIGLVSVLLILRRPIRPILGIWGAFAGLVALEAVVL